MTEWRECKLGDVIVLNYGKALPEKKRVFGNIPVYSSAGLTGYHNESLVNGRGIIIGRKGTIGSVHFSYKPFWCIDTAYYITDNEEYNLKYIYYLLQTLGLNELNEDSAVPGLNRNTAYQQDISFPPLPEQKAIAEVLSSLDDKIDLLTRQNKTLEDLAQAYFRKWFIEDASDEWEVGKLGDYIEIHDSKRVPLSKIEREKMKSGTLYPYYGAATIMDYVNDYIFDGEYILMGEDGTVETEDGYPVLQYATGKFWVNNHAHVLTAKSPFNNYFIWFFLKQCNISGIVTGAVQPKINQENLKNIDIPIPDLTLINSANQFFANIFAKILNNLEQIKTFQKLRDTLLPKLISGEIRVKM